MKKLLMILFFLAVTTASVFAEDDEIRVGVLLGFTGPVESFAPSMVSSAELAFLEASDSGLLLNGKRIRSIRADSTCIDVAAATAAAERLVTVENVVAIVGAACSAATTAVVNNVGVPNGVPMISPSATSPGLSSIKDKDFFFRVAPSDARQGAVLSDILLNRGIDEVAVTYTNNDYGKGLAESFSGSFRARGGKITIVTAHEDGKGDYSAEVAALSGSGARELVVFGYLDQGGKGIVQTAIDLGAFDRFILSDGMIGQSLINDVGDGLDGSFGVAPGGESEGVKKFVRFFRDRVRDSGESPYDSASYDAAALIALAMQAAGSTDRAAIQSRILAVANAPGEKINVGELAKGLKILSEGGDIDYIGATNVEFDDIGDVLGSYKELVVRDGKFEVVRIH